MNECLTTPQHEKQIGYWVSEKGKCMKWFSYEGFVVADCHNTNIIRPPLLTTLSFMKDLLPTTFISKIIFTVL